MNNRISKTYQVNKLRGNELEFYRYIFYSLIKTKNRINIEIHLCKLPSLSGIFRLIFKRDGISKFMILFLWNGLLLIIMFKSFLHYFFIAKREYPHSNYCATRFYKKNIFMLFKAFNKSPYSPYNYFFKKNIFCSESIKKIVHTILILSLLLFHNILQFIKLNKISKKSTLDLQIC